MSKTLAAPKPCLQKTILPYSDEGLTGTREIISTKGLPQDKIAY
ncbi:MAG TPA: hypothetical protein VGO21_03530 [Candidatus Paceibacterota bacterium]|jgi:hypothetical protein|nr:hypothetical protein [Candidatus Paceibacterota bacterium]